MTQVGGKRFSMEINLTDVQFLGCGSKEPEAVPVGAEVDDVDDLPF